MWDFNFILFLSFFGFISCFVLFFVEETFGKPLKEEIDEEREEKEN